MEYLGAPETQDFRRPEGIPREPGQPEQLVRCVKYPDGILTDVSEVQLVGFSKGMSSSHPRPTLPPLTLIELTLKSPAFFTDDTPKQMEPTRSPTQPELAFGRPITSAIDIWNLGCTASWERSESPGLIRRLTQYVDVRAGYW